jgi:hypothetical protein
VRHELIIVALNIHLFDVVQLQFFYLSLWKWQFCWLIFNIKGSRATVQAAKIDSNVIVEVIVLRCLILGYFCKKESVEQFLILMAYFEQVFLCYVIFLTATLYVLLDILFLLSQFLQVDPFISIYLYRM